MAGEQAERQPDRGAAVGERPLDALRSGRRHEARIAADQKRAELRHGEERQLVRRAVVEADTVLLAAHAIGERSAARHDHGTAAAFAEHRGDLGKLRRAGKAPADLDDRDAHEAWSETARCITSSTPAPPGPSSSFSTRTVTRSARGS